MSVLVDLAVGWFRVGLFAFGGGQSIVPLIRVECVERYRWLDDTTLLDAIAYGNALPGPITLKLAALVGMQQAGLLGSLVAMTALTFPGVVMMLALWSLYARFRDHPSLAGMLRGLRPVGVALLAYATWEMAPDGVRDLPAAAIGAAALVALLLDVHPALVVLGGMGAGVLVTRA